MSYLISVVIPTKDRYKYLCESLNTLIKICTDEMEIVVQDNTEENSEIIEFISNSGCINIKYYHTKESITVSENCELGVENANGEFICLIGDDDSVSEKLIDTVKLMQKYSIDACNCSMSKYYWPDVKFKNIKKPKLSFDTRKAKIKKINTKKKLVEYLSNGMQEIRYLPRAYHGIISKKILNKIKSRSGYYFPGPSPDMANAVAAATIIEEHYFIRMPLIISGSSYKSAAGLGQRGKHKGKLAGLKHLPNDIEETWDIRIPKLWLAHTIWPESCIKALKAMEELDYEKHMNWNSMFARILIRHPEYIFLVKNYVLNINSYFKIGVEGFKSIIKWLISKSALYLRRLFRLEYSSLNTITLSDACDLTNEFNSKYNNMELIEEAFIKNKASN